MTLFDSMDGKGLSKKLASRVKITQWIFFLFTCLGPRRAYQIFTQWISFETFKKIFGPLIFTQQLASHNSPIDMLSLFFWDPARHVRGHDTATPRPATAGESRGQPERRMILVYFG
jgi:hypothetical protein